MEYRSKMERERTNIVFEKRFGNKVIGKLEKKEEREKILLLGRSSCSSAVGGSWGRQHALPWAPETSARSALPWG